MYQFIQRDEIIRNFDFLKIVGMQKLKVRAYNILEIAAVIEEHRQPTNKSERKICHKLQKDQKNLYPMSSL